MKRHLVFVLAMLLLGSWLKPASGYEVRTHIGITEAAYRRSTLAEPETRTLFGLDRLEDTAPFRPWFGEEDLLDRDFYMDLLPTWLPEDAIPPEHLRSAMLYEARYIQQMEGIRRGDDEDTVDPHDPTRLQSWLMRGAVREDDVGPVSSGEGPPPDPDPHGDIVRVLSHFYDPIGNTSFVFEIPGEPPLAFIRAIDWAIGVENALAPSFNPLLTRRNHFSWVDARNAQWLALTYKPQPGQVDADGRLAQLRLGFMASSVKSLGHALHLLQDAAQPQHSRNDPHNHSEAGFASFINTSVLRRTMEVFTEFRATDGRFFGPDSDTMVFQDMFGGIPRSQAVRPPFDSNYPIPQFTTPVRYLTTRHVDSEVLDRRGMADYSNRGFFSEGSLPRPTSGFEFPPDDLFDGGYVETPRPIVLPDGRNAIEFKLRRVVPDSVQPGLAEEVDLGTVTLFRPWLTDRHIGVLSLDDYSAHADNLIPRAVAYSAGMIDYFFRGRLEVLPPLTGAFAIVNHLEPHTMDGDGYPRRNDDNRIFGFESLRLRVRNATDPIVEAGTGQSFPQYIGDPDGPDGLRGELVAVARFQRNLCYQPDLSGERLQGYLPPPGIGPITDPTCPNGRRSGYPEISVSAPITIETTGTFTNSELDLLPPGTGVDLRFDFSGDPIPVNATDLFIQVVYRGRLGFYVGLGPHTLEPDGIAVGSYDAREPTFLTYWNNTDYFNNNGTWQAANAARPARTTESFWVCTGSGPNRHLAWTYFSSVKGGVAMPIPPNAGFVRMAAITGIPGGTAQHIFRGVPDSVLTPKPEPRSIATRGQVKQASHENIDASLLDSPLGDCDTNPPTATEYWCDGPLQRRRALVIGQRVQPIYQEAPGSGNPIDVDHPPLPALTSLVPRTGGTLRYETDEPLVGCPEPTGADPKAMELLELKEMLAELGEDI